MVISLCHYKQLKIKNFKKELGNLKNPILSLKYEYHNKFYLLKISTARTECHFGGSRLWWVCPKCSRRASILYKNGMYICRHCIGKNYLTQNVQPYQRELIKLDKIRNKLEWNDELSEILATKPKGMHQSTFDKLLSEYATLEEKLDETSQFSTRI